MFLKRPGSTRGVEPVFSEKDQAINPHRKREPRHHVSGCETSRSQLRWWQNWKRFNAFLSHVA
jgi:hypothetical protein